MMNQYDNLFANYDQNLDDYVPIKKDGSHTSVGQYVVDRSDLISRCTSNNWEHSWFLVYRNITNTTNERTLIASIIPFYAPVFSLRVVFGLDVNDSYLILANMNSLPCDYIVRNKMGGTNLSDYIMKQIPFVSKSTYSEKLRKCIKERVLRLQYFNEEIEPFIRSLNESIDSSVWNDRARFQLQCELDAIYAHLYGLEKEEMDYILESFPITKRKDKEIHNSYRTKETILRLYDEFAWVREEMQKPA